VLAPEQRIELEKAGPELVAIKLSSYGGGRGSALNGAFPCEVMTRGDVEDWLSETLRARSATERAERISTLRWAKIAGAAATLAVVIALLAWLFPR